MSGWSSGHDSVLAVNSLVEFALQEQVTNRKENQENSKFLYESQPIKLRNFKVN